EFRRVLFRSGDRYRLLASPAGGHVFVWYTVWDDDAAANRFADAYRQVLRLRVAARQGMVERMTVAGRPVVRVGEAESGVALADVPIAGIQLSGRPPCGGGCGGPGAELPSCAIELPGGEPSGRGLRWVGERPGGPAASPGGL